MSSALWLSTQWFSSAVWCWAEPAKTLRFWILWVWTFQELLAPPGLLLGLHEASQLCHPKLFVNPWLTFTNDLMTHVNVAVQSLQSSHDTDSLWWHHPRLHSGSPLFPGVCLLLGMAAKAKPTDQITLSTEMLRILPLYHDRTAYRKLLGFPGVHKVVWMIKAVPFWSNPQG